VVTICIFSFDFVACIAHYKCASILSRLLADIELGHQQLDTLSSYWFCGPPKIRLIVLDFGWSLLRSKLAPNCHPPNTTNFAETTHKNWPNMGAYY